MNIKNELEKIIIKALGELGIEADNVRLEHPVDLKMGDYSTNVAMVYSRPVRNRLPEATVVSNGAKQAKQSPRELAEKIVEKIPVTGLLEKVEVAGPGFINFYLKADFFAQTISEIIKEGEGYGSNENLKSEKILIEHSSPNLFKEFHIGHMVNNSIGESISRIIKKSGANTKVISYPSDVGLGIAKAIWATKKNFGVDKFLNNNLSLEEKITALGVCYVEGNKKYKEDENIKKQIDEINKKIYDKSDEEINKIYNEGKKLTLKYFEQIVARLGSKFDDYIFESEAAEVGKKIIEENVGKVFEESDGAIVFKAEKFDESLHTRVFINSNGVPTYEAKDIGLLQLKFTKFQKLGFFGFKPDKSIFLTDHEQGEYMKVMLKAAEQINPEWAEKTKHIVHGRLRFPTGRLSSREGNVIPANELLDMVKEDVLKKMEETDRVENKEKTAEQIAVGAIKYSILKSSAGKNIIFEKEKALSLEGNSGPYLQYTYARAKSIIEKAKNENVKMWVLGDFKEESEISEVEKLLYRFPEVVERAGKEYEPHYIATYLFELSQAFNSYYGNNKIVDKNDDSSSYKVALTEAVAQIIKNGLWLLGIETPERL